MRPRRGRPVRRARLCSGLGLLAMLVPACGSSMPRTAASEAAVKDLLPLTAWVGPTASLHPHEGNADVTAALFTGLVWTAPDNRLPSWGPDVPQALMASLSSTDLRRWDIEIKPDWRWHDGTIVEAADVARGWQTAIDAGLPAVSTIADIRVRSTTQLSVALDAPFGQFPALLADQAFLPLPPLAEEDAGRFQQTPLGNGPFQLVGREGETLLLEAVEGHPAGQPVTSALAISREETPPPGVDIVLLPDGVTVLPDGTPQVEVIRVPGRQLAYLGFPLNRPGFGELDARRALSLALDVEAIAAEVMDGAVIPADRLLGPGVSRGEGVTCAACGYDPDEAAALWPDELPGPLTIWFPSGAGHEAMIDAVAGSWQEVLGIQDIQLASLPAEDLIQRLAGAEVDGPFRLAWAADVPSPSRVLEPLFGPRGSANDFRHRTPATADLLDAAASERDLTAALDAYAAAEQQVLDDLPLIPLWFSTRTIAAAGGVAAPADGLGQLDWARVAGP